MTFQPGYDPRRYAHGFTDRNRRVDSPAARVGVAPGEFERRVAAGEKWCMLCKAWHPREEFGPDRARHDGLQPACREAKRRYQRARYRRQKGRAA